MTNRNRSMKSETRPKENKNGKDNKRKETGMNGSLISLFISGIALLVSIVSVFANLYYSNKEYEYKLDSEVEVTGGFGIQLVQDTNQQELEPFIESLNIEILEKNNLQGAYLIHSDNTVDQLDLNKMEESLITNLKMDRANLVIGNITYQYEFLLLKGLDDTSELYLIYTKSNEEIFNFNGVSGIEIWGLANSHLDDPDFEGEKIMATQYEQIIKDSEKYIF